MSCSKACWLSALVIGLALVGGSALWASPPKLKVMTTTTDLAAIARAIGGDAVSVSSMVSGSRDLHSIEPRPSMAFALRDADMLIRIGMQLDVWVDGLVMAAHNPRIAYSGKGYLDASKDIRKLQVPTGSISGAQGDIHLEGNPHYWLDPENGKVIAGEIKDRLSMLLPSQKGMFEDRYVAFCRSIDDRIPAWQHGIGRFKGKEWVSYHATFVYLAHRFGVELPATIEVKPGIPPTPGHLLRLLRLLESKKVSLIVMEPYYPMDMAKDLSAKSGVPTVIIPTSTGPQDSYPALFDTIAKKLEALP